MTHTEKGKNFRSGAGHVDQLNRKWRLEFSKFYHDFIRHFAEMPASAVQLAKRASVRLPVAFASHYKVHVKINGTHLMLMSLLVQLLETLVLNTDPLRKFFLFLHLGNLG